MTTSTLTELVITSTAEHAPALEACMFELGASSVVFEDAADQPLLEPPLGTHPLWSHLVLVALFPDRVRAELAAAALQSVEGVLACTTRAVDHQDWVRVGLADLGRIHCGGSLWIVPSWESPPEDPEAVCVHLDPGLAFGTGTHPTTALCLAALAHNPPRQTDILDYGCGSGILAIAAMQLGAQAGWAIDIDPQAVLATEHNAMRNGVTAERLNMGLPEHLPPQAQFDVVIANILANPLIELAPTLTRHARPGARLLLAGLLARQAEAVLAAYQPHFALEVVAEREGWVLVEGWRQPSLAG